MSNASVDGQERRRKDYDEMSNRELLEEVAALDEDTYPIATRAQEALDQVEWSDE